MVGNRDSQHGLFLRGDSVSKGPGSGVAHDALPNATVNVEIFIDSKRINDFFAM